MLKNYYQIKKHKKKTTLYRNIEETNKNLYDTIEENQKELGRFIRTS